jgi:predicted lipid carrier protein YhbT
MTDMTAAFFDDLRRRGHEDTLRRIEGTVRFDVVDGDRVDHWLVTIDKGDLAVSRANGPADCVVSGEKALFDRLATGQANPMAAVLRGAVSVAGDLDLLLAVQRVFPGPQPVPAEASKGSVGR